jgi:hypothetical protein
MGGCEVGRGGKERRKNVLQSLAATALKETVVRPQSKTSDLPIMITDISQYRLRFWVLSAIKERVPFELLDSAALL